MNIKSLLLGSAAALLAVTGARAADAVVAPEPEPVEYVRVCDLYGAGYYYIPGTEICLKFGGYVRYDIGVGDLFGDSTDGDPTDAESYHKRGRYALRAEARTETELGTLQGKVQINFNWATSNGGAPGAEFHPVGNSEGIERAWVKLGGLMWGVEDSQFVMWTGYASGVVNDGLIPYGPFTTHQISYTFDAGNGFSLMAGVEEGNNDDSAYTAAGSITDYAPHVVAGAAYKTGIFGLSAVGSWDSVQDEFSVKGRLDITPNDMFSVFVMGAWTDDDDGSGGNFYATWGGDWALWAGGAVNVSDRITLNAEFGYNEFSDYSIDVDANFTVVPGLVVTPGVGFRHGDGDPLSAIPADDSWGGYLRTQFTF
jgi:opacity protein-like surface antigen